MSSQKKEEKKKRAAMRHRDRQRGSDSLPNEKQSQRSSVPPEQQE
jgi:hypothetical protein